MDARQGYALSHVSTDPVNTLDPGLHRVVAHRKGWLLYSVLAVDR